MTAQIPEILIYKNKKRAMCSEPLKMYFELSGRKIKSKYVCSALDRGYVGTWEIISDCLYLTKLQIGIKKKSDNVLETYFPDCAGQVFARWFTGKVRVHKGKMLKYVHAGYASVYEKDLFLYFEKGVLTKSEVVKNEEFSSMETRA